MKKLWEQSSIKPFHQHEGKWFIVYSDSNLEKKRLAKDLNFKFLLSVLEK